MFNLIQTWDIAFPSTIPISNEAKSIIKSLLTKDCTKRLGAGENGYKDIMDHEWFEDFDFVELM